MLSSLIGLAVALAAPEETPELRTVEVVDERARPRVPVDATTTIDLARVERAQSRGDVAAALEQASGLVVRERYNDAQDLQLSARGFGARSTFGIRGVQLVVDGIPATAADGQGQLSAVLLDRAAWIDVERGPLAALAGNAAGAVVRIESNIAASPTTFDASGDANLWRASAGASLTRGPIAAAATLAHREFSGFRPHSGAVRDQLDAGVRGTFGEGTWDATVNVLDQPHADDPLGLTRGEFEADPYSTTPNAIAFDTRKSVRQGQAGSAWRRAVGRDGRVEIATYAGERDVVQFLAVPLAVQATPTHPGGVIDLGRDTAGLDVRAWQGMTLGAVHVRGTVTASFDALRETRRGYENFVRAGGATALGVRGALRRDERNDADGIDLAARVDASFPYGWSAVAGYRDSRLDVRSDDRYVTATNPDDTGALRYDDGGAVAALAWQSGGLRVHGAWGEGFESPTLNELAYRGDGSAGLNTALEPSTNTQHELGLRHAVGDAALELTAYRVDTDDEIVVDANRGGRSSFRNAGRTQRDGFDVAFRRTFGAGTDVRLVASYLDARFVDAFGATRAGARLPGIPARSAHASVEHDFGDGWYAGLAGDYAGRVAVDDANRDFAASYATFDVYGGRRIALGDSTLELYARLANAGDRVHAGSVIVNESNQRYFEPAPGRRLLVGATLAFD